MCEVDDRSTPTPDAIPSNLCKSLERTYIGSTKEETKLLSKILGIDSE